MKLAHSILVSTSAAAFLCCVTPAHAADAKERDPYQECLKRFQDNTHWAGCGVTELARQEALLADAWRQAKAAIAENGDDAEAKRLLHEQRQWIKWKDASCELYNAGDFGRLGEALSFYGCKISVIKDRISDLNGYIPEDEVPEQKPPQ